MDVQRTMVSFRSSGLRCLTVLVGSLAGVLPAGCQRDVLVEDVQSFVHDFALQALAAALL